MTPEEINSLAVVIASVLAKDCNKKEILNLKHLLQQIISNLCSYLLD